MLLGESSLKNLARKLLAFAAVFLLTSSSDHAADKAKVETYFARAEFLNADRFLEHFGSRSTE